MMETPRLSHRRSSRASTRSAVEEVAQLAVAGPDHEQASHRNLGPTDVVAKETPVDAIGGVSASARLLDLQPPSTAGRTFSASTATGFASGASDATHMVLREGEGEASTPRLQRAEAKRAAQNNLKRKLEKLAAAHQRGTFLAPRMAKRTHTTECEVEQGQDAPRERDVFKTPPRSAFAIAADGDVARLRTVPGDDNARESEFRLDDDAGTGAGRLFDSRRLERDASAPRGLDVLPEIAGALNAQCMAGIANAGVVEAGAVRTDACAEENDDGCSVASDTGAGEDGTRERGDLADAFAGEEDVFDADGSGRRTLRNLLVRHVNTGIASDAVALAPARLANRGALVRVREALGATAEGGGSAGDGDGGACSARAAIRKTVAAKESRAFDSPPRAGHGRSALFRGRSGGNLRNLVASERRASASPSGSEGFAFVGAG